MSARMTSAEGHMAKAQEFYEIAAATEVKEWDAAVSNAAIAGINAADVLITLASGRLGHDREHVAAVKLLRSLGLKEASNQLQRLLNIKNVAQYGERRCTATEAREAVLRAERLRDAARVQLDREKRNV